MKKFLYLLLMTVAGVYITACGWADIHESSFTDANAFVAFPSTSGSISEDGGSITIKVLLSSVSSLNGTATIEVDNQASTAIAGNHYVDPESITLTFGGSIQNAEQSFTVTILDNDIYEDNQTLVFKIVSVTGNIVIGEEDTYTLTIIDDDHPLSGFVGQRKFTSGSSAWEYVLTVVSGANPDELVVYDFPFSPENGLYEDITIKVNLDTGNASIQPVADIPSNFGNWDYGLWNGANTSAPVPGVVENNIDIQFTGNMVAWFPSGVNAGIAIFNQTDLRMAD